MEAFVYLRVRPGTRRSGPEPAHLLGDRPALGRGGRGLGCALPDRRTRPRHDRDRRPVRDPDDRGHRSARYTAPVVPQDRLGVVGFGGLPTPQIIRGACYVHIEAEPGAAAGLYERLSEIGGVSGAAVLGGRWDLIACIPEPWEVASGIVLDKVQRSQVSGRPAPSSRSTTRSPTRTGTSSAPGRSHRRRNGRRPDALAGSANRTLSSVISACSTRSKPLAASHSSISVTSHSGAEAPDVSPTTSAPSSQAGSTSVASSTR